MSEVREEEEEQGQEGRSERPALKRRTSGNEATVENGENVERSALGGGEEFVQSKSDGRARFCRKVSGDVLPRGFHGIRCSLPLLSLFVLSFLLPVPSYQT